MSKPKIVKLPMGDITIIKLPIGSIEVRLCNGGGGSITSKLHDGGHDRAIGALESLILAHACEGVNIQSKKYVNGIRTALDLIANTYY